MSAWNATFAIGHTDIDRDHRELFELLEMARSYDKIGDKEFTLKVLKNLELYAKRHFDLEEGLLEIAGYPGLNAHKAQHAAFTKTVAKFRSEFATGSLDGIAGVISFLQEWLTQHILVQDKAYKEYVKHALMPG